MSQLSTQPVVKCRRCGRPLVLTHLSTTVPDESGELLFEMMEMVGRKALCDPCQKQYNYYASIGRSREWELGLP